MSLKVKFHIKLTHFNLLDTTDLSSNSIQVRPSFIGYSVNINPNLHGTLQLCQHCDYYITFSNSEINQTTRIQFKVFSVKDEVKIDSSKGDISLVNTGQAQCYYYKIDNLLKDDNVIVTTTLFSGKTYLFVTPGENVYKKTKAISNIKNKVEVDLEKVMKITPNDRMFNETISSDLYICIYGVRTSSYYIRIMMENEQEVHQNSNVLFNGN